MLKKEATCNSQEGAPSFAEFQILAVRGRVDNRSLTWQQITHASVPSGVHVERKDLSGTTVYQLHFEVNDVWPDRTSRKFQASTLPTSSRCTLLTHLTIRVFLKLMQRWPTASRHIISKPCLLPHRATVENRRKAWKGLCVLRSNGMKWTRRFVE
jgi:hypothetical protein